MIRPLMLAVAGVALLLAASPLFAVALFSESGPGASTETTLILPPVGDHTGPGASDPVAFGLDCDETMLEGGAQS